MFIVTFSWDVAYLFSLGFKLQNKNKVQEILNIIFINDIYEDKDFTYYETDLLVTSNVTQSF